MSNSKISNSPSFQKSTLLFAILFLSSPLTSTIIPDPYQQMPIQVPPIRQLRDRNSIVAPKTSAQKPSKPLTPMSEKAFTTGLVRSSSGKENHRPSSHPRAAAAQKPTIRPMPRIDKVAAAGSVSGLELQRRRSVSSVPRGRSSSPSEFIRVFSNVKKDRDSIFSKDLEDINTSEGRKGDRLLKSKVIQGTKNETKVLRDFKENCEIGRNLSEICEEFQTEVDVSQRIYNGTSVCANTINKGIVLGSELIKSSFASDGFKSKAVDCFKADTGVPKKNGSVLKSDGRVESNNIKTSVDKCLSNVKDLEILKEKCLGEDISRGSTGIKYQSKLHEKLAFLEGKVKRIASDIKRTKEMLDTNNSDASKEILSDIQKKISGIEKVMGHVDAVGDSNGKVSSLQGGGKDDKGNKVLDSDKKEGGFKNSAKGLNIEELEARLLPHEKLLRSRTSTKASSQTSQNLQPPKLIETNCDLNETEKSLSSINGNPVALEFLALLKGEKDQFTKRDSMVISEFSEVQATDGGVTPTKVNNSSASTAKHDDELILTTDEAYDEFDSQENMHEFIAEADSGNSGNYQLNAIGQKNSTAGWFVSDVESVLLAHDDGSCTFYDIPNCEEKTVYKPPVEVSPSIWRDCWIIRASGADGCSERYVVAASAGNSGDSGYCSWDFYEKNVKGFHINNSGKTTSSGTILGPLNNNPPHRRNPLSSIMLQETQQWWYKPCGPLIVSTATSQKVVKVYDIRDGKPVMRWEVQKPVSTMDYSSPLQWRNRGKVVIAESEALSVWDVNSLNPQALLSVSSSGRKISALHVNNTDAEVSSCSGVRQRVSSAEAEGNDGVFCTPDSINILDFRNPSGIGHKIPKVGISVQSVYSRGDSIFFGCTNFRSAGKKPYCSQVQQFSLRKQRLHSTYSLPDSCAHLNSSAITQVWGNSNLVMGVCASGLFVFDALNDDAIQSTAVGYDNTQQFSQIIGPDDLYSPTFDYSSSRVLLISRDRPAMWRHLA